MTQCLELGMSPVSDTTLVSRLRPIPPLNPMVSIMVSQDHRMLDVEGRLALVSSNPPRSGAGWAHVLSGANLSGYNH